jgi:hypothetical protein
MPVRFVQAETLVFSVISILLISKKSFKGKIYARFKCNSHLDELQLNIIIIRISCCSQE